MNKNIPITIVCPGAIATPFLSQSFTEKLNEKFGQETDTQAKNKLTPQRCAHLMAIAMANRLNECWIAHSTSLQLTYFAVYYPNIARMFVDFVQIFLSFTLRNIINFPINFFFFFRIFEFLGPTFLQRLRDNKVTMKIAEKSN